MLCEKDEEYWWNNLPASDYVERDLDDTERCDVIVVYLPKVSAGACMELFYAKLVVLKEIKSIKKRLKHMLQSW